MGVASVWSTISDGFDERLPFAVLVTNFYKEHNRPIRIAIDAFQWIFEATASENLGLTTDARISRLLQIFHSRIRTLISLNVSFVFVFDGNLKPNFKRNPEAQEHLQGSLEFQEFDEDYLMLKERLSEDGTSSLYVKDTKDIKALKEELRRWNVTFVECPSEGEAEAARLQRMGVVDYVLSNDSDTIIFGATKILRNFSRFEQDKPAGAMQSGKASDYFWCTPVDMEKVLRKTGYDQWRVLLFSILTGADYNHGVTGLGSTRASQIALSSTGFIKKHYATCHYDDFPDFASELKSLYIDKDSPFVILPEHSSRVLEYEAFKTRMFEFVSQNVLPYFNRNERSLIDSDGFENFPPDYVVMLYFYPLLSSDMYQFEYGTTNFAETDDPQKWIELPKFNESLENFSKCVPPGVTNVDLWYIKSLSQAYLLRFIIHGIVIPNACIEREKTGDFENFDLDLLGVRYMNYLPDILIEKTKDLDTQRPKKGYLEWIPRGLVPETSKYYVDYKRMKMVEMQERLAKEKEKSSPKKSSPRKRKPTQTSTLETLGFVTSVSDKPRPLSAGRRKSSTAPKQTSDILLLLRSHSSLTKPIEEIPPAPKLDPPRVKPPTNKLFVDIESDSEFGDGSDSDFENQLVASSPEKPVKDSPKKIDSSMKSMIQESPVKNKANKKEADTSPSKDRNYDLLELEADLNVSFSNYEGDDPHIPISSARKKLDFSTPKKLNPISKLKQQERADTSIISVSDTSMINSSDLMEISHISEEIPTPEHRCSSPVMVNEITVEQEETGRFSALDEILREAEYSSDSDSS